MLMLTIKATGAFSSSFTRHQGRAFLLHPISSTTVIMTISNDLAPWTPSNPDHVLEAKKLDVWPLDEYNAGLLNEVHPRGYTKSHIESTASIVYDLIAVGAGAGGLVSSRQSARRGAKSALISEHLAGGDCLNVGCVPSKALLRAMKAALEVQRASEFGVNIKGSVDIDFGKIMERLRELRSKIAPVDGHGTTVTAGAHMYQGRGKFTGPNTIQVGNETLHFKKAVIATGGRAGIPNVPGLKESPYTTNEILFNLQTLPPRMIILGAGVIALEMAQCFATFGSEVTVLQRKKSLFESKQGDPEAAELLQKQLEKSGVQFLNGTTKQVKTLRPRSDDPAEHPLMKIQFETLDGEAKELECECLLIATGRVANVENLGLEEANVEYELGEGVKVNDLAQSVSNPSVFAVGDCVAGVPRLTHMSGEMAKLVVQNSLFGDDWKLSSLIVPATMYTEPEYATVGIYSAELAEKQGIAVDMYRTGLEHNDRAILEGSNIGFCKIFCKAGTDEIVGATIVAERAGEMINEVGLAMKNKIGLYNVGRNIHCYPTTGECVMMCGVQYINTKVLKRFGEQ